MNMIDVQDKLKGLSEDQLVREMQAPTGVAPQFLVLSEITRRKRMRDSFQSQQAQPTTTIAEEAVASAGVPQQGLGAMAQALAPNSSMAQNTAAMPQQLEPVQGMYGGGYVRKMADGGIAALMADPAARAYAEKEAQRLGMTLEQYLQQAMPPQTNQMLTDFTQRQATRNRMLGLEPVGDSITMPTQSDLDMRFAQSQGRQDIFPNSGFSEPAPMSLGMDSGTPIYNTLAGRTGTLLPEDVGVDLDLTAPKEPTAYDNIMQQVWEGTGPGAGLGGPNVIPQAQRVEPAEIQSGAAGSEYEDRLSRAERLMRDLAAERGPERAPSGRQTAYEQGRSADAYDPLAAIADPVFTAMGDFGGILAGRTVEEQNAIDAERAKIAAAEAAASEPTVTVQVAGPDTPRPKARPDGGVNDQGGVTTSDTGAVTGGNGGSGGAGGTGQSGGALGAGIGGAAGTGSSYEQELRDAMRRAEQRSKQDKWLALAQVGLNLMASKQPTLGGAIGEAGVGGLEAFRGARDAYENERLGLSKSLFDIQQQREAAMAAQRAASARATGRPLTPEQRLKQIEDRLSFLVQDDGMGGKVIMEGMDGVVASLRKEYSDILSGGGSGTFDATAQ